MVFVFGLDVMAQDTSTTKFKGYTVTYYKDEPEKESSLNIHKINTDSLSGFGNFNLTDLLAKVPGVSVLGTGPSISKPVIRGLYGNRVLVLFNGLKFDNQQWQEEHGLGLTEVGLGGIDLIKGPMSVLYGSEAIGGVINLIDEEKAAKNTKVLEAGLKMHSNTLGGAFNAGYKYNTGKKWFKLRIGIDNQADYFDGSHKRVLNSRSDCYIVKAAYGYKKGRWVKDYYFTSSFNRFGFIFNDIYTFVEEDARYNRSLKVNPAHMVLLNIASTTQSYYSKKGNVLTINAGIQSNRRMENEGGGAISLDMHLLTAQYLLKWQHSLSKKHQLIVSNLGAYENNTNYGARKIVPDAIMLETNTSAFIESKLTKKLTIENGFGIGFKQVHTFFTPSVNGQGKEVQPFNKQSPYFNGLTGINYNIDSVFYAKCNVSTGVRVANLAELSSNGLHEGVFTYEIGNPELKNEMVYSANVVIGMQMKVFEWSISPFYNLFNNYIYLGPAPGDWNGFPIFRYYQDNAFQKGLEAQLTVRPIQHTGVNVSFFAMNAWKANGESLPYTPANKLSCSVYRRINFSRSFIFISAGTDYYATQNKVAFNELRTPSYQLFNFSVNGKSGKFQQLEWKAGVNNLTDVAYYDHMSRFKYFGLLNMGRNVTVSLNWKFTQKIK